MAFSVPVALPPEQLSVKIYTLVPEVRSWQDARDYLRKEPYGLSDEEVSSPALIEQAAERLNLIFSQLKKRNKR